MPIAFDESAPHLTRGRFVRVLGVLTVLLILTLLASAVIGSVRIDLGQALFGSRDDNVDALIFFRARLPRVLLAAVVGGALAAAGAALQALLRNPLAEPHLLGVSGGAALGGVIALLIGG